MFFTTLKYKAVGLLLSHLIGSPYTIVFETPKEAKAYNHYCLQDDNCMDVMLFDDLVTREELGLDWQSEEEGAKVKEDGHCNAQGECKVTELPDGKKYVCCEAAPGDWDCSSDCGGLME